MDWIKENKIYIIGGLCVLLFFLYSSFGKETELTEENEGASDIVVNQEMDTEEVDKTKDEQETITMMADVKGAVVKPGVYQIEEGGRVIDLIELAGGLQQDADTAAINFAMHVHDEMAVYVPKVGEEVNDLLPAQSGDSAGKGKVNLNSAQSSELQTLTGIGPAKADAIIEHRETNGPFKAIDDLKEISGIGDKTFDKLKDQISVK